MNKKIVIAGVPNCGKTTLWNIMTGRHSKTGNWPGVTAETLSAPLNSYPNTEIVDLPGTYSLSGKNPEELSAINYLRRINADSLIILIDGTKPEQGFYFALELLSFGIPAVIGINFSDKLNEKHIFVDCPSLGDALGTKVIEISTLKKQNIKKLLDAALNIKKNNTKIEYWQDENERRKKAVILAEKYFIRKKNYRNKKTSALLFLVLFTFLLSALSSVLKTFFENFFEHFSLFLKNSTAFSESSNLIIELLSEGVFSGICSVLVLVPDLAVIFFILSFLEESGLMARAAFYSDYVLKTAGLSGKSMIPLITGFGCTVPAIYSARYSDGKNGAKLTLSALMFIPCSAKLPLSLLLCEELFPFFGKTSVIFFCVFSIFFGWFFLLFKGKKQRSSFVLELPELSVPSLKILLVSSKKKLFSFIKKFFIIVLITSVLIRVSLCSKLIFVPIKFIAPAFLPLGIPFEGVAALFCGLFSKEAALFSLISLSENIPQLFGKISGISFLLFYFIYSPCTAALTAIKNEFGRKTAIWLFVRQNLLAYLISFSFYQCAELIFNLFSR